MYVDRSRKKKRVLGCLSVLNAFSIFILMSNELWFELELRQHPNPNEYTHTHSLSCWTSSHELEIRSDDLYEPISITIHCHLSPWTCPYPNYTFTQLTRFFLLFFIIILCCWLFLSLYLVLISYLCICCAMEWTFVYLVACCTNWIAYEKDSYSSSLCVCVLPHVQWWWLESFALVK